MSDASRPARDPFADAIAGLTLWVPSPFFVQVGGYDGVSFDPLRRHIVERGLSGLIIEPVPVHFEKLKALYAGSDRVRTINCAIAETDGERPIWFFAPEAVTMDILPPHFGGISSFIMEDLLSDNGVLGRSCPDETAMVLLRSLVRQVSVRTARFATLFAELAVERVDILQIDTEGYDLNILRMFDFARWRPAIVQYEHQHLGADGRREAMRILSEQGYRIITQPYDTLAIREPTADLTACVPALAALAEQLCAQGRAADAAPLAAHLAALKPDDGDIRYLCARIRRANGQLLEALEDFRLLRMRHHAPPACRVEMQAAWQEAVVLYQRLLAQGAGADALRLIGAMVALMPEQRDLPREALRLALEQGLSDEAVRFAPHVLAAFPQEEVALVVMAGKARSDGAKEALRHHLTILAQVEPSALKRSVRLWHIIELLNLLREDPRAGDPALVSDLVAAAGRIVRQAPAEDAEERQRVDRVHAVIGAMTTGEIPAPRITQEG